MVGNGGGLVQIVTQGKSNPIRQLGRSLVLIKLQTAKIWCRADHVPNPIHVRSRPFFLDVPESDKGERQGMDKGDDFRSLLKANDGAPSASIDFHSLESFIIALPVEVH